MKGKEAETDAETVKDKESESVQKGVCDERG